MNKLLVVLPVFLISACSTVGVNTNNNLQQSAIEGTWAFDAQNPVFAAETPVAGDGTVAPTGAAAALTLHASAAMTRIDPTRPFFVMGSAPATLGTANAAYNVFSRTAQGGGNSDNLADGTAVYEVYYVRAGFLKTRTLASGVIQPFPRWIKIRREGNQIFSSAVFTGAVGAFNVPIAEVNMVLATLVP